MGRQETPWIDVSNQSSFSFTSQCSAISRSCPGKLAVVLWVEEDTLTFYLLFTSLQSLQPTSSPSLLLSLVFQDKREPRVAVELQPGCHGDCQSVCVTVIEAVSKPVSCLVWSCCCSRQFDQQSHSPYRHQYLRTTSPFLLWSVSNLWLRSAGHWLYLCVFRCYLHVPITVQPPNQWGTQLPAWRQTQMCGPPALSCCHTTTPHSLWTQYRTIQEISMSAKPPESTQYIP
jgi:hypothetical protein